MEKFTQAPVGLDIDQTVSSNSTAITNINNKLLRNINNVSDTQLNALTTAGVYYGWIDNGSTCPAKGQWSFIVVNSPSSGYCSQVVISAQTRATLASRYLNNGTWGSWQELVSKNDVNSLFKIVNVSKYIITSGTLDAGSTGYTDVSVTIPSGYKTLGIASIVINHPGSSNGLQVSGGVGIEQTGTFTTYVNYHSPKTIQASATDFNLVVLCIKSDYVLA